MEENQNITKQRLAILGSTGSIGTQTLDVVKAHPDRFEVYALTAHRNIGLLIEQAKAFEPEMVVVADEDYYLQLKEALSSYPIKVFAGAQAIADVAGMDCIDTVVTAMVGYSGLQPTLSAIRAGKKIALANKETLVVAGELVTALAQQYRCPILPVDSEHSAIFQCLTGEPEQAVEKIILTASGGPFRNYSAQALQHVTAAEALKHPTWEMGDKITIDSATLMNKGFEVIEAKWLFGLTPDQIEVVVHPQSIVHSMVQFCDGSVKAQLGTPDMRLPIAYALTYPERLVMPSERLDFARLGALTFEAPDVERFPNLSLAYHAMALGGNMPCVLNAANEVAVAAFLRGEVGFRPMSGLIEQVMQKVDFVKSPTYDDYVATDAQARCLAMSLIK